MTLHVSEIDALLSNLDLEGGVIQKVFEQNPTTIVFQIRKPGETLFLLFSAQPGAARFHLVDKKPNQPKTPSAFTMAARKNLQSRFEPPVRVGEDRIVSWVIGEHRFVAELTNHPALVILTGDNIVLTHTANGPKRVVAQKPYQEPDAALGVDQDRFSGNHNEVAAFYATLIEERAFTERVTALSVQLRRAKKRLKKLRTNLERDLEKCVESTEFQKWGTLLQQAYGQVERGSESIEVIDYYADGSPTIEIPLDPRKNLQDNIERYFHQYKRLSGSFDRVSERLEETHAKIETVDALLDQLNACTDRGVFEEIAARAGAARVLRAKQVQTRRQSEEKALPYRVFETGSGVPIWVGRGAKHNDALTSQFTRGKDIWLHARDWPGAHVVLKTTLERATSEDLLDAAVLTAHYSKGSGDTWVEVTYTEGKHVRKPKGAAPGLVTVSGGKTLTVRPDDPRLERLLSRE